MALHHPAPHWPLPSKTGPERQKLMMQRSYVCMRAPGFLPHKVIEEVLGYAGAVGCPRVLSQGAAFCWFLKSHQEQGPGPAGQHLA